MRAEEDPDVPWVAALSGQSLGRAKEAVDEAVAEQRLFRHLEREHRREGRESYIEIDAPLELYALTRLLKPSHVLEVGVSSGVSSTYILQALERNGRGTLHSVDRPKRPPANRSTQPSWSLPPGRFTGWAVPPGLRPRWDLRIGDKKVVLPLLAEELDRVGLFVYDVPHRDVETRGEFRTLDASLPAGAVAIADHGPGGELCEALRWWARSRGSLPRGRAGLGLYGFRAQTPGRRGRPARRG